MRARPRIFGEILTEYAEQGTKDASYLGLNEIRAEALNRMKEIGKV